MNELEIEEVLNEYSKTGQGYNIPLSAECLESYTNWADDVLDASDKTVRPFDEFA